MRLNSHSGGSCLVLLAVGGLLLAAPRLASAKAGEPPQEEIDTLTQAENVQSEAEQAPQDSATLPSKAAVEESETSALRGLTGVAGLRGVAITPRRLGLKFKRGDQGLQIEQVFKGSAADKLGFRQGDQVVSVGGRPVSNGQQFALAMQHAVHAGARDDRLSIPAVVRRDGAERTLHWTNGTLAVAGYGTLLTRYGYYLPPQIVTSYRDSGDGPFIPGNPDSGYLGVELDPRFRTAIVLRVLPGTAAERAGLQEGDHIWAINNHRIDSTNELIYWLGRMMPGDQLEVHFDRSHRVEVTLGKRAQADTTATPEARTSESAQPERTSSPGTRNGSP